MGRKRTKNKQLPQNLYKVKRKKPYCLKKPDGSRQSFMTLNEALAAWSVHYSDESESVLIGKIMDRYMVRDIPKLRERTQKDYRIHLTHLRPVFGDMDIRHLQPLHLYKYQRLRGQSSVHQANREMAVMSNVCKLAISEGLISANPCRQVTKLTEYARERDVEPAEFEAVFNNATPKLQVAMMLYAITGMRRGDIVKLRRGDFGDDGLRYTESKSQRTSEKRGGKKRHWEWSKMLHWCYDRAIALHGARPSIYLICNRDGTPFAAKTLTDQFSRAMKAAMDSGELLEPFHLNDIRAMAAADADNPFYLLAHTDGSVTMRNYLNRRARKTKPIR